MQKHKRRINNLSHFFNSPMKLQLKEKGIDINARLCNEKIMGGNLTKQAINKSNQYHYIGFNSNKPFAMSLTFLNTPLWQGN